MNEAFPEIPPYEITRFREKSKDYCVIVFCINEGKRIQSQISKMNELHRQVDIIVCDGGSTDGSLSSEFLKSENVTALITKRGDGKLSAQMRAGFDWALMSNYSGVIVMDGNDKDDSSAIPLFINKLEDGFDHVQGSRFIPGGEAINTPISRLVALKLIHSPLISFASRTKQTDTTNGFRGYSRKLLLDPQVAVFRNVFSSYELHYHLAIESGRRTEFSYTEVPVTRRYPSGEKTPTKISPFKGNLKVLSILILAVLGKYRTVKY